MIGICGDNCEYCPRYIATHNDIASDLKKVKELWVRIGLRERNFPTEKMICHGCRPENNCAYKELLTCVKNKHLENCGPCDSYPCDIINDVFKKSNKLKIHANEVCSKEEMEILNKAFFSKKENIDDFRNNFIR